MPDNYRIAKSLDKLRAQINALSPNRSKASDGWIGDPAHQSRTSDHNAWVKDGNMGIVTALDITNDPAHGISSRKLAEAIVAARDPRVKYIISDGQIVNSGKVGTTPAWAWRKYTGVNPHTKHVHISVSSAKNLYDSVADWDLSRLRKPTPTQAAKPAKKARPLLEVGARGQDVKDAQILLNKKRALVTPIDEDGFFGEQTQTAVANFQRKTPGLFADGVIGPYTWAALEA